MQDVEQNKPALDMLLKLIAPLKPGLYLGDTYRLVKILVDEKIPSGILEFFGKNKNDNFCILIKPRKEGSLWENRTKFLHLLRSEIHGLDNSESKLVLKKVTVLVSKNETEYSATFLKFLTNNKQASAKFEAPKMAVDDKIYLRITKACQFNCTFCNATEGLDSYYLTPDEVKHALDISNIKNLKQVVFSGGEPTLVKELPDYIKQAIKLGAKIVIVQTNGMKFADADYLAKFEDFKDKLGLGFSIHAASEGVSNEVVEYKNALTLQIKGLQNCLEQGFKVLVTYVATKRSMVEMSDFVQKIADMSQGHQGFHSIHFAYPIPNGNAWAKKNDMPNMTEMLTHMLPALRLARKLGVDVRMSETCAIPLCIFYNNQAERYIDILDIYGNVQEINPSERGYAKGCVGCKYKKQCAGIWHRYLSYFGEKEFVAVL